MTTILALREGRLLRRAECQDGPQPCLKHLHQIACRRPGPGDRQSAGDRHRTYGWCCLMINLLRGTTDHGWAN